MWSTEGEFNLYQCPAALTLDLLVRKLSSKTQSTVVNIIGEISHPSQGCSWAYCFESQLKPIRTGIMNNLQQQMTAGIPGRGTGSAWVLQRSWSTAQDLGYGGGEVTTRTIIPVFHLTAFTLNSQRDIHRHKTWGASCRSTDCSLPWSDRAGTRPTFIRFSHIILSDNSGIHHKWDFQNEAHPGWTPQIIPLPW
jgi:hypothetical protein